MKVVRAIAVSCLLAGAPMLAFGQGSGPPGGTGPQTAPAPQPAPQAQPAKPPKKLNPWIDCGIGALIFDEAGWAAAISNIIWDLGITATTSAMSSEHTCNSKNAKTAAFIGVTYPMLAEETAKGDGKHLRAMLEILGCEPASHRRVIATIRSEFGPYLSQPGYAVRTANARAEGYYDIVQAAVTGEHARQCGAT